MVAPVFVPVAGAAGSMVYEYATSRGQASQKDYFKAAVLGALPVGLGARGTLKAGQKLSKIRHIRELRSGDRLAGTLLAYGGRASPLSLRPEATQVGLSFVAGSLAGAAYDKMQSRGAKDSPSLRTGIAGLRGNGRKTPRKTMRGPSAQKKRNGARRAMKKKYCWRHRRYHNCVYTKQL